MPVIHPSTVLARRGNLARLPLAVIKELKVAKLQLRLNAVAHLHPHSKTAPDQPPSLVLVLPGVLAVPRLAGSPGHRLVRPQQRPNAAVRPQLQLNLVLAIHRSILPIALGVLAAPQLAGSQVLKHVHF